MVREIFWHEATLGRDERALMLHQQARCLWFTGLSGAGKSTLANALAYVLYRKGKCAYVLDGDNLRHGLNRDLGFSTEDRNENIRRVAEVAKLMVDAGLIVIVALISPFREQRDAARALFAQGEFVEVHVDAPYLTCEDRDTKGLYSKARRGLLKDFTGWDSPYESPSLPELHLKTDELSIDLCLGKILKYLQLE